MKRTLAVALLAALPLAACGGSSDEPSPSTEPAAELTTTIAPDEDAEVGEGTDVDDVEDDPDVDKAAEGTQSNVDDEDLDIAEPPADGRASGPSAEGERLAQTAIGQELSAYFLSQSDFPVNSKAEADCISGEMLVIMNDLGLGQLTQMEDFETFAAENPEVGLALISSPRQCTDLGQLFADEMLASSDGDLSPEEAKCIGDSLANNDDFWLPLIQGEEPPSSLLFSAIAECDPDLSEVLDDSGAFGEA